MSSWDLERYRRGFLQRSKLLKTGCGVGVWDLRCRGGEQSYSGGGSLLGGVDGEGRGW